MSPFNFEQVVAEIETRQFGEPNRDSCQALALVLQSNHKRILTTPRGTLVVGTNGKGSFCATVTQILRDQNIRVGTFTSPHLESICERIQIDGRPISKDLFIRCYRFCAGIKGQESLSRFEILALMAFSLFSGSVGEAPVAEMIFEAGIGGRKDAARAVPYQQVVVTRLGLDHTDILGPTLLDIEREKLAVVKDDLLFPTIIFDDSTRAKISSSIGPWAEFTCRVEPGLPPKSFLSLAGRTMALGIPGVVGRDAALMALRWAHSRGLEFEKVMESLEKVSWPGRQEFVQQNGLCVLLSGDHNPQGIESLVESLKHYTADRITIVMGVGRQKDLNSIVKLMSQTGHPIILTGTPFKGRNQFELRKVLNGDNLEVLVDPFHALEHAKSGFGPKDMVVITGSLYLVGLLRSKILKERKQEDSKCNKHK